MFGCGSNGIKIQNGLQPVPGIACIYGGGYVSNNNVDVVALDNSVDIVKTSTGINFKIDLTEGTWLIRALISVKNTDAGTDHPAVVRLLKDGGAINSAGSGNIALYQYSAINGDSYMTYHINTTCIVAAGTTSEITIEVSHTPSIGKFFVISKMLLATKSTTCTNLNP